MSSKALSLMSGMLQMEVGKRLTAIECLAHPYFDGMRNDEIDSLIQGYNQLKQ
jgi:cyclin-dependent kinase-like